jgi:hypothetical protein
MSDVDGESGGFIVWGDVVIPPRGPVARSPLLSIGLAALAHFVVLGLSMQAALACDPDREEEQRVEEVRDLLVRADADEVGHEEPVVTDVGEGNARGGTLAARRGDGRAGGGQKAAGAEGAMGASDASTAHGGRYAVPQRVTRERAPALSREEALTDAGQFGAIGLLARGPSVPVAATWGADPEAHGMDSMAARGAMWGDTLGAQRGLGGLGLSGVGDGGGGRGEGVGLASTGTLGHLGGLEGAGSGGNGRHFGGGRGRLGAASRVTMAVSYSGGEYRRGGPYVYQRMFRQNYGRMRLCYENARNRNPALGAGRITVRFIIGHQGEVVSATNGGSDFTDQELLSCVLGAFRGLSVEPPEEGIVTGTISIAFRPDSQPTSAARPSE